MSEDRFQHAREQAQAQFESIREMVDDYAGFEDKCGSEIDDLRERMQESALTVEVRSGWHAPSSATSEEYCILLCTGGPAVRIIGSLNNYCEPETARLEMQDWYLPWTPYWPDSVSVDDATEILITYARQFYFGE